MKKRFIYAILTTLITHTSCSEESNKNGKTKPEDPIVSGIMTYLSEHNLEDADYRFTDTVTYDEINSAKLSAQKSKFITDSMLIEMPLNILEAEENLATAIANRDHNTVKILTPSFEGLITKNEEIVENKKALLAKFKNLKETNDASFEFLEQFSKGEGDAYYVVEISGAQKSTKIGISKSGQVLDIPVD